MFKRAIVVTDLSDDSNTLLEHLEGIKSYGVEEILLLRALSVHQSSSIGLAYESDGIETTLQNEKRLLKNEGFKVDTKTVFGNPEREINRIAKAGGYSVVVVGAKEETLLRQAFFSELAYDVIQSSEVPVLLVRLGGKSLKEHGKSGTVLFSTDFSENSEVAFKSVKDLVEGGVEEVSLVHVQDFNRMDSERLEIMKKTLSEKKDIKVDIIIKSGSPSVEILKLAEELKPRLIVMGTHGKGFVKELFLGSVSNHMARHSEVPVLLVPVEKKRAYK